MLDAVLRRANVALVLVDRNLGFGLLRLEVLIPNDHGAEPSLGRDMLHELDGLLARLCDDALTGDDCRRLNQILDENYAARRYYLKYIAVHSSLVSTAGSFARAELNEARHRVESLARREFAGQAEPAALSAPEFSLSARRGFLSPMIRFAASLAAALAFVGFAGFVFFWADDGARHENRTVPVAATDNPTIRDVAPNVQQLVAEVTFVSATIRWRNPNESYVLASRVRAGQSLALERGQVELTYASGAKLLLTGPSEFLVEPSGGKLRRGELVAQVPKAGHGFTIETPNGKVIDLGTEFGVVVDDFGVSQVSVFEGKVETVPIGTANTAQHKFELTTGRALQWTNESVISLDAQRRRYQRPGFDASSAGSPVGLRLSIEDDFRSESLSSNWKAIGDLRTTRDGLVMGGSADTAQLPYLISAQEFEPSRSDVTVICDLRFADVRGAENPGFAILTRSSDTGSKPGTSWQDMLARCVRCSLRSDSRSGAGLMEVGTKYEADRELSNISWGGFTRPQPGALYRLRMHDDGLNVSFTVSLAENPAVRKTITARSLFRGNQNFIALEGSGGGTTVIERLQILHGTRPISDRELSSKAEESSPRLSIADSSASQLLDDLAPGQATLVLQDSFDGDELNSRIWLTLGDIVLRNGQVQLGQPNKEQHIDTWQRRPYLLTRQRFDPAAGVLTILGNVTFSANFLHGYGGSFAVLTRADKHYGKAPGWENSILRWGVRSNFWPAALGHNHSLEIQEKSASQPMSVLAAEGFQINPRSRHYLFQVVDDGRSATLTLIDAGNRDIRETIRHPTTFATPARGHVAFESCWGSPMMLDNVRIYRSEQQSHHQSSDSE